MQVKTANKQPQQKAKGNQLIVPTWKQRTEDTHPTHLQALKENPDAKVLLLGDSMIERYLTSGKDQLPKLTALNCVLAGVGGDGIQHMLYRVEHGLIEACPPGLTTVLLMAGTNNIEKAPVDDVHEAVLHLIQTLLAKKAALRVVLFGLLPRDSTVKALSHEQLAAKMRALNARLATIPEALPGVQFRDAYALFAWNEKKNAELYDDHVHLNGRGYLLFAQEIIEALGQD